jgi:hypothetical protein
MKLNHVIVTSLKLAVLLMMVASAVMAQTAATGALTGTVTDTSGAVIPNAIVTTTNSDTQQARTATTGSDGSYRISLLPPGTYNVVFSANGFKAVQETGVNINVTETPVLNRSLEVGSQTEQITVAANAEAIQTASSTVGTVVGGGTAVALPLTTRNYTNLLALSAGANASVFNATALGRGAQDMAVNGAGTAQNNYQMDGVSIVDLASGNTLGESSSAPTFGIPNPDTLQEFKIQTSLYDAGYGRNPGANVNVVTKSGTNTVHGTAFEFFRNTDMNANDFFRNRTCGLTPSACAATGKELILNANQFGGVVGGPIKKDKLFFFMSYQQTQQKNGIAPQGFVTGITLFPIPIMDRGNGSNPAQTAAFQQALGAAFCHSPTNPGGGGSGVGLQVACDGSNINPIAIKYLQAKNSDGTYAIPSSLIPGKNQTGVSFSDPALNDEYQGMLNLDYLISPKQTLISRYYRSMEPQTINFLGTNYLPGVVESNPFGYQDGVLKLTSILTSSFVNEARSSVQRNTASAVQTFPTDLYTSNIYGVPSLLGGAVPAAPAVGITGAFQMGGNNGNDTLARITQFQWADQISWTHGKHTVRAGAEYERVDWDRDYKGAEHALMNFQTFSDFLIGLPGNCGAAVVGVCNGSSFSNITNTVNASRGPAVGLVHAWRASDANLFVQDDIKVSQRLTVNIGLRWEYDGNIEDKYGNLTNIWLSAITSAPAPGSSPATGSYVGWVVPSNYSTSTYGPLPTGVITNSQTIATKTSVPLDNFAPRVGFAWQPVGGNRFVVRGGYGFFYDRVPGLGLYHATEQNPPLSITLDQGAGTNQFASLAQPFQSTPAGIFPIRWANFANATSSNISVPFMNEFYKTPLMYSYNLNFQYEFVRGWTLEAGYVGSHGIHQSEFNQVVQEASLASPTNPINGVVTTNTVTNAVLRVPYLGFSTTGMQAAVNNGDEKFNSLQATLRKQLSHGLTLQAAYTFSRAFSNLTSGTAAGSGDPLNYAQQYGLNTQYRPQRLVINYIWAIPYGNFKGVTGKILGGWSLSGVTIVQDGQPLIITDSRGGAIFGMSGANTVTSRAQMAAGETYADIGTSGSLNTRLGGASGGPGYLNAAAFTTIPVVGATPGVAGTGGTGWGDSGVGPILGPGQFNFDATLMKATRVGGIHEDAVLQFRAEFFNLFNHPQFSSPAANFAASNFGQITSASVNPRLIQLALKYVF